MGQNTGGRFSTHLQYRTGMALTIDSMTPMTLTPRGDGPAQTMNFPVGETTGLLNQCHAEALNYGFGFNADIGIYSPQVMLPIRPYEARQPDGSADGLGDSFLCTNLLRLEFPTPIKPGTTPPRPFNNSDIEVVQTLPIREIEMFNTVLDPDLRMNFSGGRLDMRLRYFDGVRNSESDIQTFTLDFPPINDLVLPNQDYRSKLWNPPLPSGTSPLSNPSSVAVQRDYLASPMWEILLGLVSSGSSSAGTLKDPIADNLIGNARGLYTYSSVSRTIELDPVKYADWRLAVLSPVIPQGSYVPLDPRYSDGAVAHVNNFGDNSLPRYRPIQETARLIANATYASSQFRSAPAQLNGARMAGGQLGDWTVGHGDINRSCDGGIVMMPDSGATGRTTFVAGDTAGAGNVSYFNSHSIVNAEDNFYQYFLTFSPNRQMYSAMQFGTLLTEAADMKPWQTLLFTKHPAAGPAHPGFVSPPDHLVADLFWVPVVDPYPISEPLSTAGKINLNTQIVPFTQIDRKTGLHALLKSTLVSAIPTSDNNTYKISSNDQATYRLPIDVEQTLTQLDVRYASGRIFKSASEICELSLVPLGQSLSGIEAWWNGQLPTGDNMREHPYGHLHARLTTKSNTFMVHYKVQALKQRGRGDPAVWEEGKDEVLAEHRGSTLLERYIDPADSRLPDFADPSVPETAKAIDQYYRFRVINTKTFMP